MGTRGYHSYRGRNGGGGKTVWVIVLVLVLLAAVAFLLAQRYVVFDEDGKARLTLFSTQKDTPKNPIAPEDVVIEREDPEDDPQKPDQPEDPREPDKPVRLKLDELHAREIEYGSLWWSLENTLRPDDEAIVIEVKRAGGGITYGTEVKTPSGATVERGVTRDNLIALLKSGHYTVARLNFLSDPTFARAHPDAALTTASGKLWYDAAGRVWLDPGNEEVRAYLIALCRECADLGFNEILLDGFCYPATGDLSAIAFPEKLNQTAVLTDFADALREALPEDVAVSITLRGDMGELGGDSGLTAELLGVFDRIYVAGEVDGTALRAALPTDFDNVGGLVIMTTYKPQKGGYVVLP
jgi:hypothetical protein